VGDCRVCVNAFITGVFRTALNASVLDGTRRGQGFLLRTPMRRFSELDELGGSAVLLVVDGGSLASGVSQ
jgi:hypothetical protein